MTDSRPPPSETAVHECPKCGQQSFLFGQDEPPPCAVCLARAAERKAKRTAARRTPVE